MNNIKKALTLLMNKVTKILKIKKQNDNKIIM